MPGLLLVDMFANSEVCLVYYWQTLFATRSLPIAPPIFGGFSSGEKTFTEKKAIIGL